MNLMDLYIKVGTEGISKTKKDINGLSAFTVAAGNLMAKGVEKGAQALVGLVKSAVNSYADFQQYEGGVKKLFGEQDAKAVIENAKKAYKTAGMSANKYLDTVTTFSSKLISDLGGDTQKAVDYADRAIRAMSDNANTFGTDISLVQNAYAGFAKQNYAMLDNLKLGYGGTASEMARLINDSGVLGDTVTVTASNINRVSFDKIIEAINTVQEEMGIAGTTFNEAEGTISGSISALKGSFGNFLKALAGSPEDVKKSLDEIEKSFETFVETVTPVIITESSNIFELLKNLVSNTDEEIARFSQEISSTFTSIVSGITRAIGDLLLDGGLETIISVAFSLIFGLLDYLVIAITDGEAIQKIAQLITNLATLLTNSDSLEKIISAAGDIVWGLTNGLVQAVPILIEAIPEIIFNIVEALLSEETIKALFDVGNSLLLYLLSGFTLFDPIFQAGKDIVEGIWAGISSMLTFLGEQVSEFFDNIFSFNSGSNGSGGGFLRNLISGSHADGLAYVPFDGYVAELHKGERVLTAKEAKAYNNGQSGGNNISIVINGANYSDERTLADAVSRALQNALDRRNAAYA